ncbi:MAG: hypothetical protein COB56_06205 [Robiginitomaculum sp.]|nr:MAG: hypothetical protein COB56_06205 [Robiginitomaculum sp.]
MTKLPILAATLTIVLLSACATYTPPAEKDIITSRTMDVSYDIAWAKATEWFANSNVPIKNIAKDSGLIATEYRLRANSDQIDCGEATGMVVITNKTANMNIFIKEKSPLSVSVSINVFGNAEAITMQGSAYETRKRIECISSGVLEREILSAIDN